MNIKEGQIVEVTEVKSNHYHEKNAKGQIFVITGLNEDASIVYVINQNYDASIKLKLEDITLGSVRLKTEFRKSLMELYKLNKKCELMEKERQRLNSEILTLRSAFVEVKDVMVDNFSTISTNNMSKISNSELFFTQTLDNAVLIGIGFEVQVERWAKVDQYSFLYREYDQSIHISDEEEGVKQIGLNIKPYESIVKKIKEETKTIKGCKFVEVKGCISVGDKDSLKSGEMFIFEISKDTLISDIKPIFKNIDIHIKEIERKFKDKY